MIVCSVPEDHRRGCPGPGLGAAAAAQVRGAVARRAGRGAVPRGAQWRHGSGGGAAVGPPLVRRVRGGGRAHPGHRGAARQRGGVGVPWAAGLGGAGAPAEAGIISLHE